MGGWQHHGAGLLLAASCLVSWRCLGSPAPRAERPANGGEGVKATPSITAKTLDRYVFGVGAGLFNLIWPQPALQASYRYGGRFDAGLQLGYMAGGYGTVSASSVYTGFDLKYHPQAAAFFFGLAAGKRDMAIKTKSDIGVDSNNTAVVWQSEVQQSLLIPRVGWTRLAKNGQGLTIALGYAAVVASSVTTAGTPATVPGLSAADYKAVRDGKARDVDKIVSMGLPHVELSYFWYLSAF